MCMKKVTVSADDPISFTLHIGGAGSLTQPAHAKGRLPHFVSAVMLPGVKDESSNIDGLAPFERYPGLGKSLSRLERAEQEHSGVCRDFLNHGGGNLYYTDFFFVGIIKRSFDLLDAAKLLISRWNFTAAAPLLRLQVDGLIRAAYLARARDPDKNNAAEAAAKAVRKPLRDGRAYATWVEAFTASGQPCYGRLYKLGPPNPIATSDAVEPNRAGFTPLPARTETGLPKGTLGRPIPIR